MKNKKRWLAIIVLLIGNVCLAQEKENKDYRQFVRGFPVQGLIDSLLTRKPVILLVKIEVDQQKNILDMQLSDSADSTLKVEFNKAKKRIATKPLTSYLRSAYSNNNCTTYIIPLSIAMFRTQVPGQVIDLNTFYNYMRFNGGLLTGDVIFLDPIARETSIPKG